MNECDRIELLELMGSNLATQYKELRFLRAEVARLLHPLSISPSRRRQSMRGRAQRNARWTLGKQLIERRM